MKTLKFKPIVFALMLFATISFAFNLPAQKGGDKWVAPESAKKMKNPTKGTKEELAMGKSLFNKHCKSCHGATGKGDGPKSKELDTKTGSFADPSFQKQTDGEIFYKTKEGKDDMPSFKKKIANDEDIWVMVNYMRTLK
ncbi:MAG: c-type cytochrome [Bacteroidia bacterium]